MLADPLAYLPAYVEVPLILANHVPYKICVLLEQMLHVDLLALVTRKGGLQVESALLNPLLQLGFVDVVLTAFTATEVENRLAHGLALIAKELSLLNESAEGGQARARTHHYDRCLWLCRQTELRLADEYRNLYFLTALRLLVLQICGGHALVDASRRRLVLHENGCNVDISGVQLSRRRDGVVTRLQAGQQLANVIDGWATGFDVLQNVDDVATGVLDPALVFLLSCNATFISICSWEFLLLVQQ